MLLLLNPLQEFELIREDLLAPLKEPPNSVYFSCGTQPDIVDLWSKEPRREVIVAAVNDDQWAHGVACCPDCKRDSGDSGHERARSKQDGGNG